MVVLIYIYSFGFIPLPNEITFVVILIIVCLIKTYFDFVFFFFVTICIKATVNSTTGTFGSSSSIPVVTVNGKGLVTSVTTSAVAGGQYFGSAATKAIAYNSTTIAENITTTSGNNCLSVGPITISSGFSVTVASGQRWVIL